MSTRTIFLALAFLLVGGTGYLAFADHDADTGSETLVLTGSVRGIPDARRGLNDIGMVSRALDASENDLLSHPVAWPGSGVRRAAASRMKGALMGVVEGSGMARFGGGSVVRRSE